jgi:NADH:ubiquinone oxidoreductase subunit D
MKRTETYQTTETPTGSRITYLASNTGRKPYHIVSMFTGNDLTTLYEGTDGTEARAIFNEYKQQYIFD